jgi:transcriptional regulator with XRE-family HTH domain
MQNIIFAAMKKEILIKFGNRVRDLRLSRNWSQEFLAEKTGFHRTYIGMVERAERNLSLINIEIYADVFDLKIYELLNFDYEI